METPASPDPVETLRVKGSARLAWILGTVAISLAMVGPCFSYLPMVVAIPLAIVSIFQARTALASSSLDESGQVYGQTAIVSAVLALVWSVVVLGILLAIVALYFGFFVAYIGLIIALIGNLPPPTP